MQEVVIKLAVIQWGIPKCGENLKYLLKERKRNPKIKKNFDLG